MYDTLIVYECAKTIKLVKWCKLEALSKFGWKHSLICLIFDVHQTILPLILRQYGERASSRKEYNSQYILPFSIFKLHPDHDVSTASCMYLNADPKKLHPKPTWIIRHVCNLLLSGTHALPNSFWTWLLVKRSYKLCDKLPLQSLYPL